MNLPLDKFDMYIESVGRSTTMHRKIMVTDTAGAVGGLFTKGELSKYIDGIG